MENLVGKWAGERILVTGAGGVLGSALLKLLHADGADFIAPRREDCDLLDVLAVREVWASYRPTIVLHLAGWVAGIQGNMTFSGRAFYDNTCINLNVIEASRLVGVRKIVGAGTTAIYSDAVSLPMRETEIWRDAPHGSEAAYAHAKRAMLAHLEAYSAQYGLEFGYMICTNLYGPSDRFDQKYGHVVPSLIARFHNAVTTNQAEIAIWGDGTPTRDFLFSEDAARAFLTVAQNGQGAYNTATGDAHTIRELVEVLAIVSGYTGKITWDTSKPNGQQLRSYDISRLVGMGWKPQVSLLDGIARSYAWYDQNQQTVRHS